MPPLRGWSLPVPSHRLAQKAGSHAHYQGLKPLHKNLEGPSEKVLSRAPWTRSPQRLKPSLLRGTYGMAEAIPCHECRVFQHPARGLLEAGEHNRTMRQLTAQIGVLIG